MTNGAPHFKNTELSALRDYVTHDSGSLNKADSTLLLMVTHSNLQARFMEIRFDRYVRARPRGEATDRSTGRSDRSFVRSRVFLPAPSSAFFSVSVSVSPPTRARALTLTLILITLPSNATQMTILRVKEKLMTHVGSNVSTMNLSLKDWDGAVVARMDDDAKARPYCIHAGWSPYDRVRVVNADP